MVAVPAFEFLLGILRATFHRVRYLTPIRLFPHVLNEDNSIYLIDVGLMNTLT